MLGLVEISYEQHRTHEKLFLPIIVNVIFSMPLLPPNSISKANTNLFYVAVVPDSCIKYILVKYFFLFVLRCIIYSKALSSFPLTNLVLPVHVRIKAILDTETKFSRVDTFVTYQDYSP